MRRVRLKLIPSAMVFILCFVSNLNLVTAQTVVQPPSVQHYTMIDLTPDGMTNATVVGVSGAQQFGNASVRSATGAAENHAILWSGSADGFTDLGSGTALAIGDGQQAGYSAFNHAALWSGTRESFIDLNPAGWNTSAAAAVGGGQQVGTANRQQTCGEKKGGCGSGTYTVVQPFLWTGSAASAVNLTPSGLGYGGGQAYGTDGVQQVGVGLRVVGFGAYSGPFAVVWSGSANSAVSLNPTDAGESAAYAVANGQQVGYAYSFQHAMLWRGSAASAVDLHPAGYTSSQARATNGTQQAGFGWVSNSAAQLPHKHALVWSGSAGSVVDLNQFMPLGFTDAAATGIDAAGNIVGWASTGSINVPANVHAVMWVPAEAAANYSQRVDLSQSSVVAGNSAEVTVTLNQPAPAGGAVVNLACVLMSSVGTVTPAVTFNMPSTVTVSEGDVSASFAVSTNATTLAGFMQPYVLDIQAAFGDTTQTALLAVTPPLSLSSFIIAPGNLPSGSTATGTIILSGAAPTEGALVSLSSNNAAVTTPAVVLVPAGQTIATFTVQANTVTTFTNVTLTATLGSVLTVSRTASVLVAPPPSAVDTVAIQKADYVTKKSELTVQATSTSQSAMLTVSVTTTGQVIGILTNKGAGSYSGTFNLPSNPRNITVTSDLSGTANRAVNLK